MNGSDSSALRLIDAKAVGRMLGCSWRTVYRQADAGRIPWGVKLGALRHAGTHAEIDGFVAQGCKPPKPRRKGTLRHGASRPRGRHRGQVGSTRL